MPGDRPVVGVSRKRIVHDAVHRRHGTIALK